MAMKSLNFISIHFLCACLHGTSSIDIDSHESILGPGEHDWGFVEVRPGAHMFWLLYYTTDSQVSSPYEKPLVIWLQGGPGDSGSGFGNFAEIGPVDLNLESRNLTWVKECNVIFIDSPVGAGFSYVDSNGALASNNTQIAEDLMGLMRSFLDSNPDFKEVPTYIFSESYGTKMAAEFALLWSRNHSSTKSHLKGLCLGSAWISPIHTLYSLGPYLFDRGMIDESTVQEMEEKAHESQKALMEERWLDAKLTPVVHVAKSKVMGLDIYNVFQRNERYFDEEGYIIYSSTQKDRLKTLTTLMNAKVKGALNVNNSTWIAESDEVFVSLSHDFMQSSMNLVETLLNETNLKILTYSGELDFITNPLGMYQWSKELSWKYAEEWRSSAETPFNIDGVVDGFRKIYDKFGLFRILRAGHFAPIDNPLAMLEILKYMINT